MLVDDDLSCHSLHTYVAINKEFETSMEVVNREFKVSIISNVLFMYYMYLFSKASQASTFVFKRKII